MFLINRGEIIGRFDAIYYSESNNLNIANKTIYPVKKLSDVAILQRGKFSHRPRNDERFYNGKFPFIQTGDIVRASQSNEAIKFTQTLNELGLSVSKLFIPDVLIITIAANIGDTAILTYPACFPDSLVTITPKNAAVDVYYLNVYFKYVKDYLLNLAPQAAQKNINLQQLSPTPIVVPPRKIQAEIVSIFEIAHTSKKQKQDEAAALLASIDGYLLQELGITLPPPSEKQTFFYTRINKISGGRFDPDYFDNNFSLLRQSVLNGKFNLLPVGNVCHFLSSGKTPAKIEYSDEKTAYPIIKVASYLGDTIALDKADYATRPQIYSVKKWDIFVLSAAHQAEYVGRFVKQLNETPKIPTSFVGELICLRANPQLIEPNYLFSLFSSITFKTLLNCEKRGQTSHIYANDIKHVKIPLPPLEKQTEIAEHISALRLQAKRLRSEAEAEFKSAQQTVEKMILGES
jgi:restriction endonuclease S subunit